MVGAGLSGLLTARGLARHGVDVTVLEAADRVGGRTYAESIGRGTFDLGGQWIGPTQHRMTALAAELARLNADERAYNETQAWRAQPQETWSPAFQELRKRVSLEETQCHQCRLVAEKRASGWRRDN